MYFQVNKNFQVLKEFSQTFFHINSVFLEIFKEFSEDHIAAASLAQVFKATTLDDQEVAVKVQYIDLRDRFESDVSTMDSVLNMLQIIHPQFAFKWVLKELKGTLENELDFQKEARNSEQCAEELSRFRT